MEAVYGLPEVLAIYQRALQGFCQQERGQRPLCVKAVARKKGNGRAIGGIQYFTLEDRGTKFEARASNGLEIPYNREGEFMVLLGVANWNRPPLMPQLEVVAIRRQAEQVQPNQEERLAKWQWAIVRRRREVEPLFELEGLKIAVVTTRGGEAWSDVESPVSEFRELVRIEGIWARMSDPQSVAEALVTACRKEAGYHMVILARGGGEAIEALDDEHLLNLVVRSPLPVVTAIGHTRDTLILDRIADKSLATPRECGLWLRTNLERAFLKKKSLVHAQELKALERVPQLEASMLHLAQEVKRWKRRYWLVVWLWLVTMLAIVWLWSGAENWWLRL